MKRQLIFFILILGFAMMFCSTVTAVNVNDTYTNDSDFDNGTLAGLEHNTTHNQLQISNPPTTIPFIWVPNSNEGTVSKIDTITGNELGRYRVSPYSYSSPSRTTVDLQGNCWVGNRQTGTAVKIGLYENGGYIDRNGNGIIETSTDLNSDGVISGAEILPWGQDECVLYDVILIPGKEGTYIPGQYTGGYANDGSNPGPRGIAVDAQNNVWVGTFATMKFYYINGSNGQILKTIDVSPASHTSYGAIIDENGILWSSGHAGNNILRLDPKTNSFTRINVGHFVYGLGIDRNNHLFASGWTDSKLTRINTLTGAIEWTTGCPTQSRGITVTDDGDVWVANSLAGTVTRYSNNGVLKATINVGNTPTGLSMDADGKVWVVNYGDEYIHRINPATNTIELSKRIPGGLHYGYSDMTGAISRTITTKLGTWTVTHDSEVNNVPWGIISWNSFVPTGTSLKIEARSSNDKINWSEWEEVQNGVPLSSTTHGRYLQILATFQILSGQTSPILYDLTVTANATDLSLTIIDNPNSVTAGENITYNITVKNQGLMDAVNTVITDNTWFLDNIKYSLNGIDWNNWTGSLNIGTLLAGSSKWLMISGRTRSEASGTLTNTVSVNSDTFDINSTNNAVTVSTTVTANADVYVMINDNPDPVVAGENLTYEVNVGNQGPSDAQNVVLAGNLSLSGLEYSRDSGITWNIWNGSINLGNLVSGNLETILVRGKVASSLIGTLTGTATVTSDTTDANTQNNIFSENTTINTLADLSIIGTDNPDPVMAGENLTYSVTVSNNGPSDALNVTLTGNTPLDNIEYSLDNGNTWIGSLNIGTIITGGSKTVLIRGKVSSSALGSFTSTFTVNSSTSDPNLVNNAFTESTSVNTQADILVTMSDSCDPVSAGEELTYTLNVANFGPSDARNVVLSDDFPSQLQNIQYSLDNGVQWDNWTGTLNLGNLSVNGSKPVLIKGRIPSSAHDGTISNIVSVSSDTTDPNTANNAYNESTTINNRADLAITITASNYSPHVGDNVKLTLTVINNGPSDATGVKTTYYLPYGFKHIGISSNSYNSLSGLWSIGNLTSGSKASFEITGKVENTGFINNTATVSGSQADHYMANNRANLLLTVYPNPWSPFGGPVNTSDGWNNHPGNGGSSHFGGNHYGNIGKIVPGLGVGGVGISAPPNSNNFSIYGPLAPYLIGNGNPLSGLFKYDEEAWRINHQGPSVYGPLAGILNNPFNPFNFQFYAADKLIQAGQKAWQSGNIWDFFDYNFYHFYGYSNLDKMWGGKNIKWILENFAGIDQNGNMSIGNFLLNLATIIPIGRVATVSGKLLARYLPKLGNALIKSGVVQALLKNGTVQTILKGLKGAKTYLIDPLAKWGKSILQKLPKFKVPSLGDVWKGIVDISKYINLDPKKWVETAAVIGKRFGDTWVGRKISGFGVKVYDKFKLWGKILPKEIPSIVGDGIKTIWQGAKGGIDSILGVFSDMTPRAVKEWIHTSPWRIKTFSGLKKVTSTKLYKDVHGVISPLIKRNVALRSVHNAAKKVYNEYKQLKKQGVRKYVQTKIEKHVKPAYNKYVKPVVQKAVSIGKQIYNGAKNAWNGLKKWIGWR